MMKPTAPFEIGNYQRVLFPYAYNILGIAEDAEDVVQEVMINWQQVEQATIENPKAYLIRSVVNRAINQKEKNRQQREQYIGQWLPEPVFTDNTDSRLDSSKILKYSMLVLMEQLNAKERAVFILKESFDYTHAEIAQALGLTEDNCRQLLKRAKAKIGPATVHPIEHKDALEQMEEFMKAVTLGDVAKVESWLANDVTFISDSNGKASAARNILHGIDKVRKFLIGIFTKPWPGDFVQEYAWVNHQPAIIYKVNGEILRCQLYEIQDGKVQSMHTMMNPEKLGALNRGGIKQ
ncbi:RNA polymerase sigma-70 factor [soil metagenome]